MSKYDYCCLCASDEGVFLDIFSTTQQLGNNRRLVDELETCLSVKVDQTDTLSSKLCHKCAFELGQCNEFLDKYHNVRKVSKFRYQSRCCLCQIDEKQGYLFDLSKEFRTSVDPVEKIEKCFNSNLSQREASQRKICLLCRYSLDLLFDLKNLASDVSSKLTKLTENKLSPSDLPKTETLVVVRNTTHPSKRKLKIQTSSDSENDSQTMARNRTTSKNRNETKSTGKTAMRTCGECRSTVEDGIDMYRVHQTGLTVCKMCWITMDPLKSLKSSKRKATTVPERMSTRLCTVYLKDVLCTASSQNEEAYRIKKGRKVNTASVASDESSENETKTRKKSQERSRDSVESVGAESSGHGSDDGKNTRSIRHVKRPMTSETEKLNKKPKLSAKRSNSETSVAIDLPQEKISHADVSDSAESDVSLSRKRPLRNSKSETKQPIEASQQENETAEQAKAPQLVEKPKSKIPSPKSMKTVSDDNIATVGKNVKSPNKTKKPLIRTDSPLGMANSYECKVCKVNYRNKIMGMKHELTHFKQLEIKIEKIDSQEKTEDDVATDKVCSNDSGDDADRNESDKEVTPPRLLVDDEVESNKRATKSDRNVHRASKVEQSAKKSKLLKKRTQESEEKITPASEADKTDDAELHDDSIEKDQKNTESILNNDETEQITSATSDPAVEIIEDSADTTKSDQEVTETGVDADSIEKSEISEKLADDSVKTLEKDATPEDEPSKECATITAKEDETSVESARPLSKRLQSLRKKATSIEKVIKSPAKREKSARKSDKTIETSENSFDHDKLVEIEDKMAARSIDDETERVTIIESDDDEDCHISEVVSKSSAAISTKVESHVQTKEDAQEKKGTDDEIQTIDSDSSEDEKGKTSPIIASVSTKSDTPNQDKPPSKQVASNDSVNSDEQIPITINDDVETNLETNTEDQTSTKIVEDIEERQSDKEATDSKECSKRGTPIQPTKKNAASEIIRDFTIDSDEENQPHDTNKSDDANVKEKENEQELENGTGEMDKEKKRPEGKQENEADKEEKEDKDEKEKDNDEEQETEQAEDDCAVENKEDKETGKDAEDAEKANPEEEGAENEKKKENQDKTDNRTEKESEFKTSEKKTETKSKGTNKEAKSSSPKKQTDETEKASISLRNATDALKEVIELAEAEVQKRVEEVSSLPETLEDITNEINNLIDDNDVMIVPPDEENSPLSVPEVIKDA